MLTLSTKLFSRFNRLTQKTVSVYIELYNPKGLGTWFYKRLIFELAVLIVKCQKSDVKDIM